MNEGGSDMKKNLAALFMALGLLSSPAIADETADTFGTVTAITREAKTFDIKGDDGRSYTFSVNPATSFDIENKNNMPDRDSTFEEMRVGDWVKIEYYFSTPSDLVADEVDIYR
jgi:hypothetical protein